MRTPGTISELETPVAVVDVDRMEANLRRVADYCHRYRIGWRPHIKTHKSSGLARRQLAAGACGLTVATPREAEVMADETGVEDLLVAYPPVGRGRAERIVELAPQVGLTVGLDSLEALETLAAAAERAGRRTGVLVEVDVGMGRVGVAGPDPAVEIARTAEEGSSTWFRGVMFYPGHVRGHVHGQAAEIEAVNDRLASVLEALGQAGLAPEVVSGGSTPTLWSSHRFEQLTEVRPGTNVFNDRTTVAIGACHPSECAYTVLATVVSRSVPGQAVVDAGSKALAKEELRGEGGGYGTLLEHPEVQVRAVSEEHGILDLAGSEWLPRIGERVRIVPNHVCVSVNLQDMLWGVREEDIVEAWTLSARGRAPARAPS